MSFLPRPHHVCGKVPEWFGHGPLGVYQHRCPLSGEWAVTTGPQGPETACAEWNDRYSVAPPRPVWPYDNLPPSYALGREEWPQNPRT